MSRRLAIGLLCVAASVALPSAADWLVTKEGARIETKGAWKVKGNQVVFTLPGGTLSSLRVSEIDLDASTAATAEAQAPAPPPAAEAQAEKPRPKPVLVLTDKDVRRASPEPAGDAARQEGGDAAAPAAAETTSSPVEVVGWQTRENPEGDGLEIYGSVRNNGSALAASIELIVELRDAEGKLLLETSAFLGSPALVPGKTTTFRALLPGIVDISGEPRFRVKSGEITIAAARPVPSEEGGEPDTEPPPDL